MKHRLATKTGLGLLTTEKIGAINQQRYNEEGQ